MLERNKELVYLCKKNNLVEGVDTYDQPIDVRLPLLVLSSQEILDAGGDVNKTYYNSTVVNFVGEMFTEGDVCYLREPVPNPFDEMCLDATVLVTGKRVQHSSTTITFESMV